jgi:hypothetical protein
VVGCRCAEIHGTEAIELRLLFVQIPHSDNHGHKMVIDAGQNVEAGERFGLGLDGDQSSRSEA